MAQIQTSTEIKIASPITGQKPEIIPLTNSTPVTSLFDQTFTIAATTPVTLWDGTTDVDMTDFDILISYGSGNVDLELITDQGDTVGNESSTVRVAAKTPLILRADDAYANIAGRVGGAATSGTLDVIDKIVGYNPATVSVTTRLILGT